jgi:hypothetical protein
MNMITLCGSLRCISSAALCGKKKITAVKKNLNRRERKANSPQRLAEKNLYLIQIMLFM